MLATISISGVALVCLGHHNQTPQTGWLQQQKFIFLTVLEARSPSAEWPQSWVLLRSCLLGLQKPTLLLSLYRVFSVYTQPWYLCVQVPSSNKADRLDYRLHRTPPSTLTASVKSLCPNTVTLGSGGVAISTCEFLKGHNLVHNQRYKMLTVNLYTHTFT